MLREFARSGFMFCSTRIMVPAVFLADGCWSNSANASMTILEYTTTAPAMTVNRVSFILEHQANDAGRSRQIDLWNYTTGQWETVSSTFCTTTDSTIKVDITVNPGRFINGQESGTF